MAIQTFVSGQVLTAAQVTAVQSNQYNQTVSTKTASYVLVAADVGTRVVMNSASSTTITVNTSLFSAGDTLRIHNIGAGVCTITAGTATVSSSTGLLALSQYDSGELYFTSAAVAIFFPSQQSNASGLVYISTVTLSAAAGTALQWSGTVFSSTYTNYRLVCNLTRTGGGDAVNMQLGIGTTPTAADYYGGGYLISSSGAAAVTAFNQSNTDRWTRAFGRFTTNSGCVIDITNPNVASTTGIVSNNTGGAGDADDNVSQFMGWQGGTTQFTSFALISLATSCAGTIQVYGYRIA